MFYYIYEKYIVRRMGLSKSIDLFQNCYKCILYVILKIPIDYSQNKKGNFCRKSFKCSILKGLQKL